MLISLEPEMAPDTSGYKKLGLRIMEMNFTDYIGERTPGFPLFIALAGVNYDRVMLFQLLMRIITSNALYRITFLLTNKAGVSVLVGLFPSVYV